jgi:hypothetical protein
MALVGQILLHSLQPVQTSLSRLIIDTFGLLKVGLLAGSGIHGGKGCRRRAALVLDFIGQLNYSEGLIWAGGYAGRVADVGTVIAFVCGCADNLGGAEGAGY